MEKRKGVSKLIVAILLLMILMIYIVTSVELYKAGEPERARQYYNQLINERCQATFDVASIEFGKDCSWVFQDIGYEIKCELNNPVNELEASLAQKRLELLTISRRNDEGNFVKHGFQKRNVSIK